MVLFMPMSFDLENLLSRVALIERAETFEVVKQQLRGFCAPLGYDHFVVFSASSARDDLIERLYWIEGDWFSDGRDVDAETYIRLCPVRQHMLDAREPFFWSKTGATEGDLYRIVRNPRGPGLHGLQVPVFGPTGLEGAVSLGGRGIDASAQARFGVRTLAEAVFLAARKLLDAPPAGAIEALSEREREVLGWTAAGRRQGEIAATLGLSERTVENHMRRIRRRLGVATTAQAIRVAIRNGEIAG